MIMHLTKLVDILFPPTPATLLVRKTTLQDLRDRVEVHTDAGVTSLLPFKDPLVRTIIHEAKFSHNIRAQRLLGAILREHTENMPIVPIPLSKKRYRERGYNQVAEIATYSGRTVLKQVLIRKRHTVPQADLSRQKRLKNLEGAFVCNKIPHGPFILLDDVSTTGSTLREARAAFPSHTKMFLIALSH